VRHESAALGVTFTGPGPSRFPIRFPVQLMGLQRSRRVQRVTGTEALRATEHGRNA
jgi:hypothetical protein